MLISRGNNDVVIYEIGKLRSSYFLGIWINLEVVEYSVK